MTSIEVKHSCKDCWALRLDAEDVSILYSGDTVPCESLEVGGKGVDVAVHEATFEDGFEGQAAMKSHCTTGQALHACKK